MALQNALYTGDLGRLRELFPPHSTADLLLESRAARAAWSSCQRGRPGVRGAPRGRAGPHRGAGGRGPGPGALAGRAGRGRGLRLPRPGRPQRWPGPRRRLRHQRPGAVEGLPVQHPRSEALVSDLRGGADTPLHVAASRGHAEVLRLLLGRGARPDGAPGGRTALHEACAAGHPACVHALLVAGADPDAPDPRESAPCISAKGPAPLSARAVERLAPHPRGAAQHLPRRAAPARGPEPGAPRNAAGAPPFLRLPLGLGGAAALAAAPEPLRPPRPPAGPLP
ncbi:ankyrin repeat and SOCS box protein 10, partial [Perognathus longimembris pacificus]|uniref:ankyrin repeat and SOCS box protein 10 n=1 Tax=Perognathus longimembris pacificus TaxID=214514 RepID=UPI002018935E